MSDARGPTRLHLAEFSSPAESKVALGDATPGTEASGRSLRASLPQNGGTPEKGARRQARERQAPRSVPRRHIGSTVFAVLWLAALGGYVAGYYGPAILAPQSITIWAGLLGAALIPIALVVVLVEVMTQARRLAKATYTISRLASRMLEPETEAGERIASVGSAVRKQLDLLSSALDSTLDRVAAIESMVETQVGAVERVGGRAQMRAQMIRDLLQDERNALNAIAETLNASAGAVAEVIGARITEIRDVQERALRELRDADAALSARGEALLRAADETARKTSESLAGVDGATERLEQTSARALERADGLSHRMAQNLEALRDAGDRLDAERTRLETLIESESTLINRIDTAAASLPDRLKPALENATLDLERALEQAQSRAAEAARALKTESEDAARAGDEAAKAIAAAAAAGRKSAEELRADMASDIATVTKGLEERLGAVSTLAATLNQALTQTGKSTDTLTSSLHEAMRGIESANARLASVIQHIGKETMAARAALDEAASATERRFTRVPELAAEQAARLSSLLGDQATRMGALAQSLANALPAGRDAEPHTVLTAPPQEPDSGVLLPSAEPALPASSQTPIPVAVEPIPAVDREHLSSRTTLEDPATASSPSDAIALPTILRGASDSEGEDNLHAETPLFSLARIGRLLGRGGYRKDDASPGRLPEEPFDGDEINHGFWTSLFARIEGNDHPVLAEPPVAITYTEQTAPVAPTLDRTKIYHGLEGLHAIAIDLDRLLEDVTPVDLWKRYRDGERDVFARRLLSQKGEALDQRIRQKYAGDSEFREHASRYLERFAELLLEIPDESRRAAIQTTPAGRLNLLLKRALG